MPYNFDDLCSNYEVQTKKVETTKSKVDNFNHFSVKGFLFRPKTFWLGSILFTVFIDLILIALKGSLPQVIFNMIAYSLGFLGLPLGILIYLIMETPIAYLIRSLNQAFYNKKVVAYEQAKNSQQDILESIRHTAEELAPKYVENSAVQAAANKIAEDLLHIIRYPAVDLDSKKKEYLFSYSYQVFDSQIKFYSSWNGKKNEYIRKSIENTYLGVVSVERYVKIETQRLDDYYDTERERYNADLDFLKSVLFKTYGYSNLPNRSAIVGVTFALAKLIPDTLQKAYQNSGLKNGYTLGSIELNALNPKAEWTITIENPAYKEKAKEPELKSW